MSRGAAARAWGTAVLAALVGGSTGAAAEPPRAVVHMPHGGSVPGRLLDVDDGVLRLESELFAEPLALPVGACERIRIVAAPAAAAAGAWCELRSGDVVVGRVGESDDDPLVITPASPPGAPPLRIPRRLISAVEPMESFRTMLPGDATGWELPEGAWRIDDAILACGTPGGTAACAIAGAPRRACFDLLLAWRERPDFDLAFGAAAGGGPTPPAEVYRVEATAGTVLAVRETGAVRFEEVARVAGAPGRLALRVFIDRDAGRMAVVVRDPAGMQHVAFDEAVTPRRDEAGEGFFVRLRRGDLRIERLRVGCWTGDAVPVPPPVDEPRVDPPADAVQVAFAGGARLGGRLLGIADGKVRLSISLADEPLAIGLDEVVAIEPLVAAEIPALPGTVGRLSAGDATLLGCLVGTGSAGLPGWQPLGSRVGVAFATQAGAARIVYRGLDALGGVGVSLVRRGDDWKVADVMPGAAADRSGRIRPGDRVTAITQADGDPVPTRGRREAEVRGLVAGPIGSTVRLSIEREGGGDAVELVRDARGRDDLAGAAPRDVLDRALALQQAAGAAVADRAAAAVVLQSGDSVTGTVSAIDADHVRMTIRGTGTAVEIDEALVKAVEFGGGSPRPLSRQKLDRLLTLPRSQQAAPPRHVLRTVAGDVLRGTLVSLDDTAAVFEVGGIDKRLARRDVSRIIWLAPPPEAAADRPAKEELPAAVVVGTDGRRLSLAAARVEGPRLVGASEAFGPMRIGLGACREVFLGGSVEPRESASSPYEQWVLTPSAPPRGGAADDRGSR